MAEGLRKINPNLPNLQGKKGKRKLLTLPRQILISARSDLSFNCGGNLILMKNNTDQKEEIERGMEVAADKPEIMPDQASEQIRPVYEDIQRTLRVPVVNLIFRILANYPDYLEPMWKGLSPAFRTSAFEKKADSLRGKALLEQVPLSSEGNWESLGEMERLRAFNDTIHYVLPKLLLITTVFYEASFGKMWEKEGKLDQDKEGKFAEIPLGVAEGTTTVQMVNPEKASAHLRSLFASIKEKHGHSVVTSYYRGIANWPDFLQEAWSRLQPIVGSSIYEERKQDLIDQALADIQDLPIPKIEKPIMKEEESSEIKQILSAFQHKLIPEMLLDIILIKCMLEGVKATSISRFSVAE